ncbi:MAG TPA: hypothetical protein P5317_07765 [Myxococcota bacterium]|nr:hypothetical protein [Myxococcota bacterium]HRV17891.1 hypothetical protein [Myxococcota bacterium]
MGNFPFDVPTHQYMMYRIPDKDGKTVIVVEWQLFNIAVRRYVEPLYWSHQW